MFKLLTGINAPIGFGSYSSESRTDKQSPAFPPLERPIIILVFFSSFSRKPNEMDAIPIGSEGCDVFYFKCHININQDHATNISSMYFEWERDKLPEMNSPFLKLCRLGT